MIVLNAADCGDDNSDDSTSSGDGIGNNIGDCLNAIRDLSDCAPIIVRN